VVARFSEATSPSRQLFYLSYNQTGAGGYRFRPHIGA